MCNVQFKGVTKKIIEGEPKIYEKKYLKTKQNLAGRNYNLTSKTKTQYSINYILISPKSNWS